MSPASKSKSRDKRAATGKEQQKTPSKPLTNANTGGGLPTSGYNPLMGTFHTLETAPVTSVPAPQVNGRFRNIDETDDQSGNSFGTGAEYDSVSNNGSWSGESEDHKDKISHHPSRQEAIIPGADSDKREKTRQKNERKHQRQKERRAQELHERCSGYLMSRKLEALAQQFVAMGFSSERATMALILNEGRVEQSVAWLFEGGEEADKHRTEQNLDGGGNLKIDISEELARIADMEIEFKCSKQEVERAIVACEGDLEQAADTLRVQKQEPPFVPPKPEETGDLPTSNGNISRHILVAPPTSQNLLRTQPKPTMSSAAGSTTISQKKDEKDFNYTRMTAAVGLSAESGGKNIQLLKKIQTKVDWPKQQQIAVPSIAAEKRWLIAGSNPSASYSLASPLQASPPLAKTETRYASVGNELKNLQLGSLREPVVVMQRSHSKQMPTFSVASSSSSSSSALSHAAADWRPNGVERVMKSNGFVHNPSNSRSFTSPTYVSGAGNQLYDQVRYQQQALQYVSCNVPVDSGQPGTTYQGNVLWNRTGSTSPTLAPASSLGLFSGLGSNGPSGPSSPVDWNAGGSMLRHLDYTSIDWSLDRAPSSSRPTVTWQGGSSSFMQQGKTDSDSDSYAITSDRNIKTTLRPELSNGNIGVSMIAGLQDGVASSEASSSIGSREWTSPFEEKDLFSFPRQFVSSPSL